MSKFLKRLKKIAGKHMDNAIVIGIDQNNINDLVENLKTLFVVDFEQIPPREKNIIHVQDLSFLANMLNINVIFLNQRYDDNTVSFIVSLVRRVQPVIFLKLSGDISKEYLEFFKRIRYEMLDVSGEYQIWKIIRR
jgi:hypothetical protein